MRRALLALLILAIATPVIAGPAAKVVAKPQAEAAVAAAPTFVLPPPIPLASPRPTGDATQCRAVCAKTLYFCKAGGDEDGCGPRWAQCNASCTATYTAPRFGR